MVKRLTDYFRQYDHNLWVLSTGWFTSSLGFAASMPFVSIYFYSEFGMSMTQIGLFFGVMAVFRSVFQAVGGELSDRIERRWLLVYSQYARAAAFVLMALAIEFSWGFWPIAVAMVINSVFGAVYQPAANATVSDLLPKAQRLDGYAITRAAGNLGWAAGPAIGGFLASASYAWLFYISAVITIGSALIFQFLFHAPPARKAGDRFRFADLLAVRKDPNLLRHVVLLFALYLVVAQLVVPFSVYTVDMAGISKAQLGTLYTLNGLLVVIFQLPITRLLRKFALTTQIAAGSLLYVVGYGSIGMFAGYHYFFIAMIIITVGEVTMSPPTLTLTSRLAPEGRMGRYMGIHGFMVASGWSFGPLWGGVILDHFKHSWPVAWLLISSMAVISCLGYVWFRKRLPREIDAEPNPI